MIILGIDPGYGRVGYGVIKKHKGALIYVAVGCIETQKTETPAQRLHDIYKKLSSIIETYKPERMAIEQIFFAKNTKTALRVAETRGVLLLLGEEYHVPICEFTPLQVKMAVSGYGKADKQQVQQMITRILNLSKPPRLDDASDALAIAITAAVSRFL